MHANDHSGNSPPAALAAELPLFAAEYAPADELLVPRLLAETAEDAATEARVTARAHRYITAIRAARGGIGGLEDFMHDYSLSTPEGLALMSLAEALLRIPDAATQDRLIEDKLGAADWEHARRRGKATAFSSRRPRGRSGLTARIVHRPRRRKESSGDWRSGSDSRRSARRRARPCACSDINSCSARRSRMRWRVAREARREGVFATPSTCWEGRANGPRRRTLRAPTPGPSNGRPNRRKAGSGRPRRLDKAVGPVPAVCGEQRSAGSAELTPRVNRARPAAKAHEINLTIDAEEADRLEMSLEVCRPLAEPSSPAGPAWGSRCRPIRSARPQ